MTTAAILEQGALPFSVESRILRELGERLVRQPEVALLELIKNAYDADATSCTITTTDFSIAVEDTGLGMTLANFSSAWMKIGTSSKERGEFSPKFGREVTGEKGIGRFAVRFLGRVLELDSIAFDPVRKHKTRLQARFDWEDFDAGEDLGKITVPYTLTRVGEDVDTGTTLIISSLRDNALALDWKKIGTGSVGVLSAVRSLLSAPPAARRSKDHEVDPGFMLVANDGGAEDFDLSGVLLSKFVLQALVTVEKNRLNIRVFRPGESEAYIQVDDAIENLVGTLSADIRFFPRRPGTFTDAPVDGRAAYRWVRDNGGVKVFDRGFQVQPYGEGEEGDDWLFLVRDAARNERHPQSSVTRKHFAMSKEVHASPKTNWMLRLPESAQLIGAVEVRGRRTTASSDIGLVAAADREGFVANGAFAQLVDIIRGAVEMIAVADRQLQQEADARRAQELIEEARKKTAAAIEEIESDKTLKPHHRNRIVAMLAESQDRIERQEAGSKDREQQLEVMSLLGVIGGFMTHEFGTAIAELREAEQELNELAKQIPEFSERAKKFAGHISKLESFVSYSELYIRGARGMPIKPYPVRPRLTQVKKLFDEYAEARKIDIEIGVEKDLMAPLVPVSLYNGIAQNLLTNALKAVTASTDGGTRTIALRAWNEGARHYLQVSDTGVGIPAPVRDLVFDPLFTTTESRADPLGSGMGLGLALVRRGAAAFGGSAQLTTPPPGFSTCVEVQFPIVEDIQLEA
jgi:signal transduction histidine kinase